MVKQTAGRDALHDSAPKFAELNDDVLFGEVWSREGQLPLKLRSIVTITALISKGITDSSLTYHLTTAKQNGVTKTEMAEILTHLAFYAGWPNAWAAFRQTKEVYADGSADANGGLFGLGEPNTAYAQYFTGESFLNPLTDPTKTVFLANVTFSPAFAKACAACAFFCSSAAVSSRAFAAASCCCARTVWAGIRRRARAHRPCTPATS